MGRGIPVQRDREATGTLAGCAEVGTSIAISMVWIGSGVPVRHVSSATGKWVVGEDVAGCVGSRGEPMELSAVGPYASGLVAEGESYEGNICALMVVCSLVVCSFSSFPFRFAFG